MNNQRMVLASRPVGIPQPQHFRLETVELAAPKSGELLIENLYLSVDPAQRGYVNDENNYAPPVPIGDVMRALAVGRVQASLAPGFAPGDLVYGWFGWQQYCVCPPASVLRRIDPELAPLSANAGLLGINGLTAYLAMQQIGNPKAGETVLVTAAAGAVGSLVGQLARLAGCRTVAVVGSDEKGQQCLEDFGFDAWINYRQPLGPALNRACPGGVDIFFDNTAGEIADAVYPAMAMFGRVIQCGTISIASWVPTPMGPRRERDILTRRLRVEGFVIFDHVKHYDEAARALARLVHEGKLRYVEDIHGTLADAPQALVDVYSGKNRGKRLIRLR